jgi:hypothetical protein
MTNKYHGNCNACGEPVKPGTGILETLGRRRGYKLWCMDCYNRSDNSGPEDRCCGDRAYEDMCAERCGY